MVTEFLKYIERKCVSKLGDCKNVQYHWKNEWLLVFFRNNHSTSERKQNWNQLFFGNKHTIAERIAQTMDDCKICRQNKYSVL